MKEQFFFLKGPLQILLLSYCSNVAKFRVASGHTRQFCDEYLQGWRILDISRQLVPMFHYAHHAHFSRNIHQHSFCCSMCLLSLNLLQLTFEQSLALSSLKSPSRGCREQAGAFWALSMLSKPSPASSHLSSAFMSLTTLVALHWTPCMSFLQHWAAQTRHVAPDPVPQVD